MRWCGVLRNVAGTEPVVTTRNSHRWAQESRRYNSPESFWTHSHRPLHDVHLGRFSLAKGSNKLWSERLDACC